MRLHDYLDFHAREWPESDFAIFEGRRQSYGEAMLEANRLAHALLSCGLERGDRVGILAKNCIEYMLFYYAASKAGVVPVPLNYRLAPPEWVYIANDAQVRMVLARSELAHVIDGLRGELGGVERWIALEADVPGWTPYGEWIADRPCTPPDRFIPEDADLYQMYTSGTTGRPKGAILTHRAVTAQIAQLALIVGAFARERVLVVAPVYHAAAAVQAFTAVAGGAALYIQEDFVPAEVVRALSEERIGVVTLVPAMIQACLVFVPDVAERSYRDLRLMVYGASPIAEETLRRAVEVFGCEFAQAYGMTETTAVASFLLPDQHRRAVEGEPDLLLSAGRPLPGTELRVVDENDRPVPPGTVGEILVRGPQLMRGYWNQPEASKQTLRGGWMHTGDAGMLDERGLLYVQDRVKDMIVSGGENIYPREIEDVLFQHPAVADAAVIGVPDEAWGEAVKAIVVLRQGASATEAEIIEFFRDKLAGYKRPRSVEFAEALPRNPTGKVLKRELREPYWKGHRRRVAGA
jgi:acyl-CoA synthetase (AMP-forming)/AMP-acid ligase II